MQRPIHSHHPAADLLFIHGGDGGVALGICGHLDETKTRVTAARTLRDVRIDHGHG